MNIDNVEVWVQSKKVKGKMPVDCGYNDALDEAMNIYRKYNGVYQFAKTDLVNALYKANKGCSNRDEGRSKGFNAFLSKVRK